LVLALWLTKMGVRVRIVDSPTQPGATSRALLCMLYRQLDLDGAIIEKGYTAKLWLGGQEAARVLFEKIVSGLTTSTTSSSLAEGIFRRVSLLTHSHRSTSGRPLKRQSR
jgi:hypothetical protein